MILELEFALKIIKMNTHWAKMRGVLGCLERVEICGFIVKKKKISPAYMLILNLEKVRR